MESVPVDWRAIQARAQRATFVLTRCPTLRFEVFLPLALRNLIGRERSKFRAEIQKCLLSQLSKIQGTDRLLGADFDYQVRRIFYFSFSHSSELEAELKKISSLKTSRGELNCALKIKDPEGTTGIYFIENLPNVGEKAVENILSAFLDGPDKWKEHLATSKEYPTGYAVNVNNRTNNIKIFVKGTVPLYALFLANQGKVPLTDEDGKTRNCFVHVETSLKCTECHGRGHTFEGCPIKELDKKEKGPCVKALAEAFARNRSEKSLSKRGNILIETIKGHQNHPDSRSAVKKAPRKQKVYEKKPDSDKEQENSSSPEMIILDKTKEIVVVIEDDMPPPEREISPALEDEEKSSSGTQKATNTNTTDKSKSDKMHVTSRMDNPPKMRKPSSSSLGEPDKSNNFIETIKSKNKLQEGTLKEHQEKEIRNLKEALLPPSKSELTHDPSNSLTTNQKVERRKSPRISEDAKTS